MKKDFLRPVIFTLTALFAFASQMLNAKTLSPSVSENDYSEAARKLTSSDSTKYDKARSIYTWMAQNVSYAKVNGKQKMKLLHPLTTADGVVDNKLRGEEMGICDLFYHLASPLGIGTEIVNGRIKYPDGHIEKDVQWVIADTEKGKILIDPLSGAGIKKQNGMFVPIKNNNTWFDVDPYYMIFTHMPDSVPYQMLATPIDTLTFEKLPVCFPRYSEYGIEGKTLFNAALNGKFALPKIERHDRSKIELVKLPALDTLRVGEYIDLTVRKHFPCTMYISIDGYYTDKGWTDNADGTSSLHYMLKRSGELLLLRTEDKNEFDILVHYHIPETSSSDIDAIEKANPYDSKAFDSIHRLDPVVLDSIGVDGHKLLADIKSGKVKDSLPQIDAEQTKYYKYVDFPLQLDLKKGVAVTFTLRPTDPDYEWAIVNGNKWHRDWVKNVDGSISQTITPELGTLNILVRPDKSSDDCLPCIAYRIVE